MTQRMSRVHHIKVSTPFHKSTCDTTYMYLNLNAEDYSSLQYSFRRGLESKHMRGALYHTKRIHGSEGPGRRENKFHHVLEWKKIY